MMRKHAWRKYVSSRICYSHQINKYMRLGPLFESVKLSVLISPRNLYNSLKSIRENTLFCLPVLSNAARYAKITMFVFSTRMYLRYAGHLVWSKDKFSSFIGTWPRGYKTFFVLNSIEHEILNAYQYKNIKKFGLFKAHLSLECYFSRSYMLKCQQLLAF